MDTKYFGQWQRLNVDVSKWQDNWTPKRRRPRRILSQKLSDCCKSVLNVGCGVAANTDYYKAEYFGVDVTPKFCREAHSRGVNVAVASGLNLPFRDEAFDGVCCENVLVHMPRWAWKPFIEEMIRVASKAVAFLEPRWNWQEDSRSEFKVGEHYGNLKFFWNRYSAEEVQRFFDKFEMSGEALVSTKEDWQITLYKK